jgi:beta-aspartyl-dipeptidase (metallo-type)
MLSGKAGKVHIHMGDYHTGLQPIFDLLNSTPLPITQFVPTHLSRNPDLIKESQKWFSMGGWGDITAGEDDIYDALLFYKENKIPMNRYGP